MMSGCSLFCLAVIILLIVALRNEQLQEPVLMFLLVVTRYILQEDLRSGFYIRVSVP
jgi:hypothetical protein